MTDFNWKGLPDVNDAMFLHRVKESIEMLVTQRGGAKTTLPQGMQEAINASKREAVDQAVLATNHFIDQQDGDGIKTELVFVNKFDRFKYGAYRFVIDGLEPFGGSGSLFSQVSFDSGATWITTSSYFRYYSEHSIQSGGAPVNTQAAGTAIKYNGTAFTIPMSGIVTLHLPSDLSITSRFSWDVIYGTGAPSADTYGTRGFGECTAALITGTGPTPINGIKFFFGGTPVIVGKIQMIGIPRS